MSSTDSSSQCASNFDRRSDPGNGIYISTHLVDVFYENGGCSQKNLLFTVVSLSNAVKIKVRDVSEFSFHFIVLIDWSAFEQMKRAQSLDITFDELQPQIVELLRQTINKQMQMRLEADDSKCKIVFYQKSRLKSFIFLTIDLGLANEKEFIDKMCISQLKEFSETVSTQPTISKNQLRETELLLKNALAKTCQLDKKSSSQLVQSMQNLLESERNYGVIEELRAEVKILKITKARVEQSCSELQQSCSELRQCVASKDEELETVKRQMGELRRDIEEKTKTNDEIGKDLLEANKQYDELSNEVDQLKASLVCKDDIIKSKVTELEHVNKEFQNYRDLYNADDFEKMQREMISFLESINAALKVKNEMCKKRFGL